MQPLKASYGEGQSESEGEGWLQCLKANIYATPETWPFTMAGDPGKCRPCALLAPFLFWLLPAGNRTRKTWRGGHLVARTLFRGPRVKAVPARG